MKYGKEQRRHGKLADIWEQSVRVTHTFLSEEGLKRLKTYVPAALGNVEHLR